MPGYAHILVSSTHNHEGPDVIGLWGPSPRESGVDPEYLAMMEGRVADAVRYDCGNKVQFLLANMAYGLRHPKVAPEFKKGLKKLLAR